MKVIVGTFFVLALFAEVMPTPPKPAPKPTTTPAPTPTSETNCECGRINELKVDKSKNKVNGKKKDENKEKNDEFFKYSWMVALLDTTKKPKAPFCGGSVITVKHVLTAAHCLFDATKKERLPANVEVVIGDYDLTKSDDANVQHLAVEKLIKHETYTLKGKLNDIALVVVKEQIKYNEFVGPVCMPTVPLKSNLTKQEVKAMGWGLSLKDPLKALKEIDLIVWNHPGAAQIATYRKTAKDTCVADHGGPVVWMHPNTLKYTQVGLIGEDKLTDECGTAQKIGTSTDVTAHVCWIEKQILPWRGEAKTCHEL